MMKKYLLIVMTILCACQTWAQYKQDSVMYKRGDGVKIKFNGSDTSGIKVEGSGTVINEYLRAPTPYTSARVLKFQVLTSDGDSALAAVWLDGSSQIRLVAGHKTIATLNSSGMKFSDATSTNSPWLIFQSGTSTDSVYLQFVDSDDQLYISRPIKVFDGYISNSTEGIWSNGDTLWFGTSAGRRGILLGSPASGEVLKFNGTVYTNASDLSGGGGGGGDSILVVKLSDGSVTATSVDSIKFNVNNFDITTGAGNAVNINTKQNIGTTANVTHDSLNLNKGLNVNGASSTIYLGGVNTWTTIMLNGSKNMIGIANAATGNVPLSGGTTSAWSWGKVGLTTHVSGTLPVANGGTGNTSTPTAGGLVAGNGSIYIIGNAGVSGDFAISTGTGAPTWYDLFDSANTWTDNQRYVAAGNSPYIRFIATGGDSVMIRLGDDGGLYVNTLLELESTTAAKFVTPGHFGRINDTLKVQLSTGLKDVYTSNNSGVAYIRSGVDSVNVTVASLTTNGFGQATWNTTKQYLGELSFIARAGVLTIKSSAAQAVDSVKVSYLIQGY